MIFYLLPLWLDLPPQSPVLVPLQSHCSPLFFKATRHTPALRPCFLFLSPKMLGLRYLHCFLILVWSSSHVSFSVRLSHTILVKIAHLLLPSYSYFFVPNKYNHLTYHKCYLFVSLLFVSPYYNISSMKARILTVSVTKKSPMPGTGSS